MNTLNIMILATVFTALQAKRLTFDGQNNYNKLNMDLSRLSFCWRNSQDHMKNNLCLPGMNLNGHLPAINARTGLNFDNLNLYGSVLRI